jgi:hypothetical protein
LIKVLRKDIEREVQGGSVNVKFDQMKRMMGASKLIAVFQKRSHWWKAKAIFRWKYGHVDMLVHQLRRLSKKLDATNEESNKVNALLQIVESDLVAITGMEKEMKRRRSASKRNTEEMKETFTLLTGKVQHIMNDLKAKHSEALKDVQDIYGDQSIVERDQLLKRIIKKTKNRLWRKGWVQWNYGINHQKSSYRGQKIATLHYNKQLMVKTYKAWFLYTTRSVRVETLFKRKQLCHVKEIFHILNGIRKERIYVRDLFQHIFEGTRKHVLRDVFNPWRVQTLDYQNQEEIDELKNQLKEWKIKQMCMLLNRHYRVAKKGSITQWKNEVNEAALNKRKLAKAASRMKNRKVTMVLNQWKEYVNARARQRKRVERIVSRLCNGKVYMALKHWKQVVIAINNKDATLVKRQKMLQNIVSKMFRSWQKFAVTEWKEWADSETRTRVALARAAYRMKNRCISITFQQWCAYLEMRKYKKQMMQNILTRLYKSN